MPVKVLASEEEDDDDDDAVGSVSDDDDDDDVGRVDYAVAVVHDVADGEPNAATCSTLR